MRAQPFVASPSTFGVLRGVGYCFIVVASGSATGAAQVRDRDVPDRVSCADCMLTRRVVATIGGDDTTFQGQPVRFLFSDRRREMLAAPRVQHKPLVLLDPAGGVVMELGRGGSGPGEYRAPAAFARGPGDSLWVFDRGIRRISVLGAGYRMARSFPLPFAVEQLLVLPDGTLVVNAMIGKTNLAGMPFHRVDRNGAISRSFGGDERRFISGALPDRRYMVRDGSAMLAVPVYREYRIERWSWEGLLLARWRRDPPWFRRYSTPPRMSPSVPPAPTVGGAWLDDRGRLWVFTRVPSQNWQAHLGTPIGDEGGGYANPNLEKLEDTVVEVIDLKADSVIWSERVAFRVSAVTEDGLVAVFKTGTDGVPLLQLWALELVTKRKSP